MPSQGCELAITFPTLTTLVGLLTCVDSLVPMKLRSTVEGLLTLAALIELLSSMNSLMHSEG